MLLSHLKSQGEVDVEMDAIVVHVSMNNNGIHPAFWTYLEISKLMLLISLKVVFLKSHKSSLNRSVQLLQLLYVAVTR